MYVARGVSSSGSACRAIWPTTKDVCNKVCMYQGVGTLEKLSEIDVAKYVCNIVARLKSLAYHFPGRTQI